MEIDRSFTGDEPPLPNRWRSENYTHVTVSELLGQVWYVVPDDLIGGVCIATVDKPASEIDVDAGERFIASPVHWRIAEEMVRLHNKSLRIRGEVLRRYYDSLMVGRSEPE